MTPSSACAPSSLLQEGHSSRSPTPHRWHVVERRVRRPRLNARRRLSRRRRARGPLDHLVDVPLGRRGAHAELGPRPARHVRCPPRRRQGQCSASMLRTRRSLTSSASRSTWMRKALVCGGEGLTRMPCAHPLRPGDRTLVVLAILGGSRSSPRRAATAYGRRLNRVPPMRVRQSRTCATCSSGPATAAPDSPPSPL